MLLYFYFSIFYTISLLSIQHSSADLANQSVYLNLFFYCFDFLQEHIYILISGRIWTLRLSSFVITIHIAASKAYIILSAFGTDTYYILAFLSFVISAAEWFVSMRIRGNLLQIATERRCVREHTLAELRSSVPRDQRTPPNRRYTDPSTPTKVLRARSSYYRTSSPLIAHSSYSSPKTKNIRFKALKASDDNFLLPEECFSESDYHTNSYIMLPSDVDRVWSTLTVVYGVHVHSRIVTSLPSKIRCISLNSFHKYALPFIKQHPSSSFSIFKSNPFPCSSYSELFFTFTGEESELIAQGFFELIGMKPSFQDAISDLSTKGLQIKCDSIDKLCESAAEIKDQGIHVIHDVPILESLFKNLNLDKLPPWQLTAGISIGVLALYQYKPEWRTYIKAIVLTSAIGSVAIVGLNELIINIVQLWEDRCMDDLSNIDLVSQGPEEQTALQTLFHALFSGIWMNWEYTRSLSNGKDNSTNFWNAVGGFSKVSNGISHIGKLFELILKKFTAYISGLTGAGDPFSTTLNIPQLEEYYRQWSIYEEYRWDPMSVDVRTAENFKIFYTDVKASYSKVPITAAFKPVRDEYFRLLKMMEPVMNRVGRIDYAPSGFRYEPLGILIGGSPGVGKSSMATPFLHALIGALLPADKLNAFSEFPSSEIWQFNPEQEHSTYSGQFVTSLDDFGQMKSGSPEAQSELMRIIRMINTAPYQQNMAALEDKGRIWFKSHILYATTNRTHLQESRQDIISPDAIGRRFPISYKLIPKLDYTDDDESTPLCDRRFSPKLLAESADYDPSYWEFVPWNFVTGEQSTGPVIDFFDLIDLCISTYERMRLASEKRMRFGELMRNHGISKRPDGCAPEGTHSDDFSFDLEPMEYLRKFAVDNKAKAVLALSCFSLFISGVVWFTRCDNVEQTGVLTSKEARPKLTSVIKSSIKSGIVSQINITTQQSDIISNVRSRNQYFASYTQPVIINGVVKCDAGTKFGTITFLKGRVAVIPCHFAETWITDNDMCDHPLAITLTPISAPSGGFVIPIKDLDISTVEAHNGPFRDLCVVVFPLNVHMHRSLMKFLPTESERSQYLLAKNQEAIFVRERESNQVLTCVATRLDSIAYMSAGEKVSCHGVFGYPIQSSVGDCGSLLWSATSRAGKPLILGLHICGHPKSNLSYAVDLCDDVLIDFLNRHSGIGDIPENPIVEAQIGRQFVTLDKVATIASPGASQIVKSLIGKLDPPIWGYKSLLKQAMLYEKNGIDPNSVARRKYSLCHKAIDRDQLRSVTSVVKTKLFSVVSEIKFVGAIFSYEEAILGIPSTSFRAIPRSTSPGYPFIYHRKLRGKKDWFGDLQEYSLTGPRAVELKSIVTNKLALLREGIRPDFRFIDNLKDETLPRDKVDRGATRLFSGAPLDYIILQRQYFGSFVEFIKMHKISNGCAYGINPYCIAEWTSLYAHLCSNNSQGSNAVFGDYSGYDGSLSPQLMYCVLDIINEFYRLYDETWSVNDDVIRSTLFEDVVNSIHIAPCNGESVTYQWIGSNPSGNFLTTILNSLCNQILLYWSISNIYAKVVEKPFILALDTISTHLRMITYGDDNGWTLPASIMENICLPDLTDFLNNHGYKYTDEWKNPLAFSVNLKDCSFLKRSFRLTREGYVAPLSLNTILETPLWTKKNTSRDDFIKVCKTMMCELALHGRDIFDKYSPELSNACHSEYNEYIPIDYDDCFIKAIGFEYEYIKS